MPSQFEHDYCARCVCCKNCTCLGCLEKSKIIQKLTYDLQTLQKVRKESELRGKKQDVHNKFTKTDKKVRTNTGLPNKSTLLSLFKFLEPKTNRMRYLEGSKKVICPATTKNHPKKSGPEKKLCTLDELVLTLMKLRLDINFEFLADLLGVSQGTCSKIFNTWIKFLSKELRPNFLARQRHCPKITTSVIIETVCKT